MLKMTNSQQARVLLEPKDRRGNPATVDGTPVWATSDATVATVEPDSDGLGATVKATGLTGTCRIAVTADADLGEGVRPLTGALDVDVTVGEAVVFELTAEVPTEQPDQPEPEPEPPLP